VENDRLFTATGHDCSNDILANPSRTILGGCLVSQRENYWGMGPRVKVQVGWQATDRLNLFANAGLTGLAGEIDRHTEERDDGFNSNLSKIHNVRGKIVPINDFQVGFQYSTGSLSIKLGYEIQNWVDLHDRSITNPNGESPSPGFQEVDTQDIGLEGPFGSAKFTF